MFNVSALLLDDALKPATPLTNGANFFGPPCKPCADMYAAVGLRILARCNASSVLQAKSPARDPPAVSKRVRQIWDIFTRFFRSVDFYLSHFELKTGKPVNPALENVHANNCVFLGTFVFELRAGAEQTHRRTDERQDPKCGLL